MPAGVPRAGAGSGGGAVLRFADGLSFSLDCVSLRWQGGSSRCQGLPVREARLFPLVGSGAQGAVRPLSPPLLHSRSPCVDSVARQPHTPEAAGLPRWHQQ